MSLIHSFEKSGNWLFKYRGQIPIALFVLAIPFIYSTNYKEIPPAVFAITNYIAFGLAILGFMVRAYSIGTTPQGTSGRNRDEQIAENLNSTGIYSMVRHPLYLGNYLIWAGIVLYTQNLFFLVVFTLLFWLYYERIMFAEERYLEKKFGTAFTDWSLKVPAFIPSFRNYEQGQVKLSFVTMLRRECPGIFATVISFTFVDLLIHYFRDHQWVVNEKWAYAILITGLLALLVKILKKTTNILIEKGRS